MSALEIVLGVALLVFAVGIILVVLLQEGTQQNAGIVSGSSNSFYSQNQGRALDSFLIRWTKFISIGFFLLIIALNAVLFFI